MDAHSALDGRHLHYGGAYRVANGHGTIDVRSPATSDMLGRMPIADAADVAAAVSAAEAASGPWAALNALDRGRHLRAVADIVRSRMGPLATRESEITGRPIREMRAQMSRIPE